jgi:hypothetical protein
MKFRGQDYDLSFEGVVVQILLLYTGICSLMAYDKEDSVVLLKSIGEERFHGSQSFVSIRAHVSG